jgi:hypothetical protein
MTIQEILKNADWVCYDCGIEFGQRRTLVSTWHVGECDVCGQEKPITEVRDFGYFNKTLMTPKQQRESLKRALFNMSNE